VTWWPFKKRRPPIPAGRAYEWTCEPCCLRYVFRLEQDLETNKQNHLASEWHARNTECPQ
jgi:hypothetical protein